MTDKVETKQIEKEEVVNTEAPEALDPREWMRKPVDRDWETLHV